IHTVGPVWHGGDKGEANLLASCYQRSLELAADHNLQTLAFPSISTGIYGYPIQQAAEIAVATVREFLAQPTSLTEVTFCCFSQRDLQIYQQLLRSIHDR
ncbi:MAG: macro domain-containing protein, partial [Caldilineaceae bacterium]|nr:macro domain-containing protein [Caldilineaceae bacterium]